MASHLGAVPCTNHTPQAAKQLLQKNYKHQSVTPRGNALRGCSGTHLLIVVGSAVESGRVTMSEVGEITLGVGRADTGESVQENSSRS